MPYEVTDNENEQIKPGLSSYCQTPSSFKDCRIYFLLNYCGFGTSFSSWFDLPDFIYSFGIDLS